MRLVRLTRFTDLALRIVMYLAVSGAGTTITAKEAATVVGVPVSHAAKAATRLRELGVVEAQRGRGGGLRLTERGRQASVGWLVRELEGAGDVASCSNPPCPLRPACRLRGALRNAQEEFFAALDPVTVSDLTSTPSPVPLDWPSSS